MTWSKTTEQWSLWRGNVTLIPFSSVKCFVWSENTTQLALVTNCLSTFCLATGAKLGLITIDLTVLNRSYSARLYVYIKLALCIFINVAVFGAWEMGSSQNLRSLALPLPGHRPSKRSTSSACDVRVGASCSGTAGRPTKPPLGNHANWLGTSWNEAKQSRCESTRNSRLVGSHLDSQRAGRGWRGGGGALAAEIKVWFSHVKINQRLWGTTSQWLERKLRSHQRAVRWLSQWGWVGWVHKELCIASFLVAHCKPNAMYYILPSLPYFFLLILWNNKNIVSSEALLMFFF